MTGYSLALRLGTGKGMQDGRRRVDTGSKNGLYVLLKSCIMKRPVFEFGRVQGFEVRLHARLVCCLCVVDALAIFSYHEIFRACILCLKK
jgi:hypothetical protein